MAKKPVPKPQTPKPASHSQPDLSAIDLREEISQAVFRALVDKRLRCSAVRLITFSIGNIRKKDDSMTLFCDVTMTWVDSPSTNVTVQHVATSVQLGAAAATTNTQDVPPTQTSVVISGVYGGSVVSGSVVADNGISQAPAATGTFTVPADLSAPQPASGLTFTIGNVRDDGSGTASTTPAATTPPAAPSEPASTPPAT